MTHLELAKEAIEISKQLFKEFTHQSLEIARRLIQVEDNFNALSSNSDIPKAGDEKVRIDTPLEKKAEPIIKKVEAQKSTKPIDDDSDLPF